jgi:hypothetical protein
VNAYETISLVIGSLVTVIVPVIIFLLRGAIKWTRVEDKLDQAIIRLETLVRDKDATHAVMVQQMTEDRKATDQRLRWLEENIWRHVLGATRPRQGNDNG